MPNSSDSGGMGFTIHLEKAPDSGEAGKSSQNSQTTKSESESKTVTSRAKNPEDPGHYGNPKVQGPFVSKAAHAELADVKMSDEGIRTILSQEGYSASAYPDADGYSVGYGHFLGPGTRGKGVNIDAHEGLLLLAKDLKKYEGGVLSKVTHPLTDKQLSALVSFTYNAGNGALDGRIVSALNGGDFEKAAEYMSHYNKSRDASGKLSVNKDLVARRAYERSLLVPGVKLAGN